MTTTIDRTETAAMQVVAAYRSAAEKGATTEYCYDEAFDKARGLRGAASDNSNHYTGYRTSSNYPTRKFLFADGSAVSFMYGGVWDCCPPDDSFQP